MSKANHILHGLEAQESNIRKHRMSTSKSQNSPRWEGQGEKEDAWDSPF